MFYCKPSSSIITWQKLWRQVHLDVQNVNEEWFSYTIPQRYMPCLLHTFPIHFNLFSDDVNAAHWNKDTSFNTIPQSNAKQPAEYTHPYLFSTLRLRQYESVQQQSNFVATVVVIAIMQTNIL